jgi:membrane protein implicated in regulation of membrane protease activity
VPLRLRGASSAGLVKKVGRFLQAALGELIGFLLVSLLFAMVLLPLLVLGNGEWWEAFVLAPLIVLVALIVATVRDAIEGRHETADERAAYNRRRLNQISTAVRRLGRKDRGAGG